MDEAQEDSGPRDEVHRAQQLFEPRMNEYVEIWEGAMAKMMNGSYRSEDLLEDWFSWAGRAVRDMTAATTIGFSSLASAARPQPNLDGDDAP